jgi:LSD1 subclass zinc finger protein
MPITTNCPGCSAPLQVSEGQTSITCGFCGTHFSVDLDETSPELHKATPPDQNAAQDDAYDPQHAYAQPARDENELYNPPISGTNTGDPSVTIITPADADQAGSFSSADEPQPDFYRTVLDRGRLLGNRLWVPIAIAVFSILCVSCLCIWAIFNGFRQLF